MIKPLRLLAGLGLYALPFSSHAVSLQLYSKAWIDAGRIMRATDILQTNFNGNWEQSMGMQVSGAVTWAKTWKADSGSA